jgi:transcription antitermination protein NusB
MGMRHTSRVLALQAVYALEMNSETTGPEAVEAARAEAEGSALDEQFVRDLVDGVRTHLASLDRAVERTSRNWRVRRMDRIDKSILRIGVYELLHHPETPAAVVLDESIELAREFGTPESGSFINGILDRIARDHRPAEFHEAST